MFEAILVANRGEIACRVMRTARQLGIRSVAVYSDADRTARHVSMADEAVYIGAAPARESYLRADRILEACQRTGAQAVHPGYGFLSENADFARRCEEAGIVFIGPPAGAIEAMGSKSAAKRIMEEAGVPLVPGYHGDDLGDEALKTAALEMGFPVLLKATAGGGGKGMRLVSEMEGFDEALSAARREAQSSFGSDEMLVEKYVLQPRHVEIQVFRDAQGNGVFLFERDCSVQRRHQKIIEEAPAPGVDEALRNEMGHAALRAAEAIDYRNAGTVEFLLDGEGQFYFMEMNTRLQVEHPVTEMITGLDLVEWQLRVAAGEDLPLAQQDLSIRGHAFEARIYAEDPEAGFLPATGTLEHLRAPAESRHVRIDTGVQQGDEVSVHYDPMIAKLVTWDETRTRALARLRRALADYRVAGLKTNIAFLHRLAGCRPFVDAELDTGFIERHQDVLFGQADEIRRQSLPLAALYLLLREAQSAPPGDGLWRSRDAWRLNQPRLHRRVLRTGDEEIVVEAEEVSGVGERRFLLSIAGDVTEASGWLEESVLHAGIGGHSRRVTVVDAAGPDGDGFVVFTSGGSCRFGVVHPDLGDGEGGATAAGFTAPMSGVVVGIRVEPGDRVEAEQVLVVMEAMKMEHAIRAPSAGTVDEVCFSEGDTVDGGQELLLFTPDDGQA